jgi:hypothetical protein
LRDKKIIRQESTYNDKIEFSRPAFRMKVPNLSWNTRRLLVLCSFGHKKQGYFRAATRGVWGTISGIIAAIGPGLRQNAYWGAFSQLSRYFWLINGCGNSSLRSVPALQHRICVDFHFETDYSIAAHRRRSMILIRKMSPSALLQSSKSGTAHISLTIIRPIGSFAFIERRALRFPSDSLLRGITTTILFGAEISRQSPTRAARSPRGRKLTKLGFRSSITGLRFDVSSGFRQSNPAMNWSNAPTLLELLDTVRSGNAFLSSTVCRFRNLAK